MRHGSAWPESEHGGHARELATTMGARSAFKPRKKPQANFADPCQSGASLEAMAIGGVRVFKKCGLQLFVLAALAACAAVPAPADAAGSKGFKPGARTLGDPILPQLGNGGYEARHYDIELDFDPAQNRFNSAVTTLKARATQTCRSSASTSRISTFRRCG